MSTDTQLNASEKMAMQVVLSALKPLSKLRRSMPLPFATTFLLVAVDEGRTVSSYAHQLGITRFMMSRYVRNVGEHARNGGPGLGLVTVKPHPTVANGLQVYLTAKGRSLAKVIFQQMRNGQSAQ